jgi:hypothetical protein
MKCRHYNTTSLTFVLLLYRETIKMNTVIKTAIAAAIISTSTAAAAATDCNARHDEHNLSYNYVASNPGDLITVNNTEYRIIRMPFVEFGSNKRFYVQYPVAVQEPQFARQQLSTYHDITAPTGCLNLQMAGEHVNVDLPTTVRDNRSISVSSTISSGAEGIYYLNIVASDLTSRATIVIRVGETTLRVSVQASVSEQNTVTETLEPQFSTIYDFTDNFDYSKMIDGTTTQAVEDLMDYVTIGTL